MRYILKRHKLFRYLFTSAANTAILEDAKVRETMECTPNELVVLFNPVLTISVGGANAGGDILFSVFINKGTILGQPKKILWNETIPAATLLQTYTRRNSLPGDNWETDDRSGVVDLFPNDRLVFTAGAGGALCTITYLFYGEAYVFEEIKEEIGKEITTPLPTMPLQRAGWWQ